MAKSKTKRKRTGRRKPPGYLMRRYKKRGRIDTRRAPDWWLSAPEEVEAYLRSLKGVEVFSLGESAGGRPILAAAWGEHESLKGRTSTSLASAIAGGDPEAFYGKGRRKRQSFVFLGAAHGTEIEGTVAALNFLNVVVKGRDLRGRQRTRMAREGRKLRIVVIPFFNIDGRARFAERRHFIGVEPDDYRLMSQGNWRTGEKLSWPKSKLTVPIPPDRVEPLGSYFNDNGVNLVYDAGFGDEAQPETRALIRFLREEMPDCVLCSHTNSGSLVQPPDAFVPRHYQQRQMHMAAVAGARCRRERMKKSSVPRRTESYAGEVFYQTDMIYHVCGALPLLVEFPCGYQNVPDNPDEVCDIGMYVIEEIVAFGAAYGFRPEDPRWK